MQIVDAHHHLWDAADPRYMNFRGGGRQRFWGNFNETSARYLVDDYLRDFRPAGLVKSVHVEAGFDPSDPIAETRLLQAMADDPTAAGFPHAIVALTDLSDPQVERVLEAQASHANVRGVRQMLNRDETSMLCLADRDHLADSQWQRNFALLRGYGLSFDLSVNPAQMPQAAALARAHPDIPLALCHLGFPIERHGWGIECWRAGMAALRDCPNVCVKMSGIGMFDRYWTRESVRRIVCEALDLFGPDRMMFGSNFPIDKLMASAVELKQALLDVTGMLSDEEQRQLFFGTASRFYRI
ncbi:amidohydrolase family protein [Sphingomonas sp. MG17]|uniref:Amidohydrolase family protein n=1 Tax=Sphingomonas tagetis TaxID=2949092 RepID=A0A9X2KMM5_9SPHN|nr:amidohydrolase family protein [Sphingomonas tagetis]MCP3732789.1 amidohydrolase family protein [Sphingomonas tagetis]